MRHEDAKALLCYLTRAKARHALMTGGNPVSLLQGHSSGSRQIMQTVIVEEMRLAVERVAADASFYRGQLQMLLAGMPA